MLVKRTDTTTDSIRKHKVAKVAREAYGIYSCNGILFIHESPLRAETFVTRKNTRALARIKLGLQDKLYLGNLGYLRDWSHARYMSRCSGACSSRTNPRTS